MPNAQIIAPDELFPAVQAAEIAATSFQDTLNVAGGNTTTGGAQAGNLIPENAPSAGADGNAGDGKPKPQKADSNKAGGQIHTAMSVPDVTKLGRTPTEQDTRAFTGDTTDYAGIAGMAPGVTAEQTVQGQLAHLFENPDANPLWEYAKGIASQYSNSRGLQNSDIAAEAGAQAVFAQAMPIAQQDANTYAARAQLEAGFWQNAGLQAQAATIASGLQAQGHLETLIELNRQGDINSRLQLEQFGYNFELNEQENLHQKQQLALQGDIQAELALQQFGFDTQLMKQDHGYRVNLMKIELSNALRINEQTNNHQLQQMQVANRNALQQINQGHANTLQQIAANGANRRREIALQNEGQLNQISAQGNQNRQTQAQADRARLAQIAAQGNQNRSTQAQADRARLEQIAAQGAEDSRRQSQADAARLDQIAAQGREDAARQASDEQARLDQIAADSAARQQQDDERFTRDLQQNYLLATERRTTQFSSEVQNIWSNSGLTAAQQNNAVNRARQNYLSDLQLIQSQYSSSPYWDPRWTFKPASTPSNPNPGGPGGPSTPPPSVPPPTTNPPPRNTPPRTQPGRTPGGGGRRTAGGGANQLSSLQVNAGGTTGKPSGYAYTPPVQVPPTVALQPPPRASGTRIGGRATGGQLTR